MDSIIWTSTHQDCPCYKRAVECQICSHHRFTQSLFVALFPQGPSSYLVQIDSFCIFLHGTDNTLSLIHDMLSLDMHLLSFHVMFYLKLTPMNLKNVLSASTQILFLTMELTSHPQKRSSRAILRELNGVTMSPSILKHLDRYNSSLFSM